MKILLLNFLVLSVLSSAFAQSKGTLNYKLTTKSSFGNNEVNKIIYFDGHRSIEFDVPKNISPSSKQKSETKYAETIIITSKKQSFINKDLKAGRLILSDNIDLKKILIRDSLNNFKWIISQDYKVIGKFKCRKALTYFRGRNYIAWYTEDVPLRNGPWKFCGLPGLIVNISDDKNIFSYELSGINLKANFTTSILEIPKEYEHAQAINHKTFINLFNRKIEDYRKLSRTYASNSKIQVNNFSINIPEKQEKF